MEAIPGTIEVQDASIDDEIFQQAVMAQEFPLHPKVEITELPEALTVETSAESPIGDFVESERSLNVCQNKIITNDDLSSLPEENFEAEYLEEEYDNTEYLVNDNSGETLVGREEEEDVDEEEEAEAEAEVEDDEEEEEVLMGVEEEEGEEDYSMLSPSEDDLALKMSKSYQTNQLDYASDENKLKNDYVKYSIDKRNPIADKRTLNQPNVIKRKFFKSRNTVYDKISEQLPDGKEVTIMRDSRNISYLVVDSKEKENMSSKKMTPTLSLKNARSILKSNYIVSAEEQTNVNCIKKTMCTTVRMLNNRNVQTIDDMKSSDENKAPSEVKIEPKSARQPRKQTIKPVERVGSEIIVQPMYYTFNNDFAPEMDIRRKRKYNNNRITSEEIVKVSDDSDPDYTDKPKPKRKKKTIRGSFSRMKKIPEIMILDSDISSEDESVIEVFSDREEEKEEEEDSGDDDEKVKKENKGDGVEESRSYPDASDDISKIQEAVDDIVLERKKAQRLKGTEHERNESRSLTVKNDTSDSSKQQSKKLAVRGKNVKCPMCPKTFPRQINLKTHMNIHSNRRVLRSKTSTDTDVKNVAKKIVSNVDSMERSETFICPECKQRFFSKIQLTRHSTVHRVGRNRSGDAKITLPRTEKRTTRNNDLSPKKLRKSSVRVPMRLLRLSSAGRHAQTAKLRPLKQPSPGERFKCDACPKSFSSQTVLNSHRLVHKTFACCNCNVKFSTKLLLDEHLRKNCVKTPVHRRSVRRLSARKPVKVALSCQVCKRPFPSLTRLHEHEALTHKKRNANNASVKTPRSVRKTATATATTTTTTKKPHGGVPASTKMRKAFDFIKLKS